jgi:hypothetical protein
MLHKTVSHLVVHYLASLHRIKHTLRRRQVDLTAVAQSEEDVQPPNYWESYGMQGVPCKRSEPRSVLHCVTTQHDRKRGLAFTESALVDEKIAQGTYEGILSLDTLSAKGTHAPINLLRTASAEVFLCYDFGDWASGRRICCPHRTTYPHTRSPPKTSISPIFRVLIR